MFQNFILDWSGTLADDLTAVIAGTNRVFAEYGRPAIEREEFRATFRLPYRDFYAERLPGVAIEEIDAWYRLGFEPLQDAIPLLPETPRFLHRAREAGCRLFVLSSVAPGHFAAQAQRLGVYDCFEEICAGVHDKREGIVDLVRRRGLRPAETAMVGDMVHDIEAARAAGVHAIALLSGYDGPARLAAAGPDLIAPHIGTLADLLPAGRPSPPDRPIVTVGAVITDPAGRVLLCRSAKWSDKWGIPGGKVQRGEPMEAALRREVREETGLELGELTFLQSLDCIDPGEFLHPAHFLLLAWSAPALAPVEVRLNEEAQAWQWVESGRVFDLALNEPSRTLLELWQSRV